MSRRFASTACLGLLLSPMLASPLASQSVIRADSPLVLIPAHVTTVTGASVTTLNKENFLLTEDNEEQKIAHFAKDDAPVSIGFLFDTSGSMRSKMPKALEASAAFFKTSNSEDEFFLVEFNESAKLAGHFTSDSDELYDRIVRAKPFGRTSLLDAIHVALLQMKRARNTRRALVVLSDGGDNWSRHTAREVRNELLESDVQLYAIGIFDLEGEARTPEERGGPQLLSDLAGLPGGRHYPVKNLNDLPVISAALGKELRNEYLLGYYPGKYSRDGKYHKVSVKLVMPDADPGELRTYYRRGYYAPAE